VNQFEADPFGSLISEFNLIFLPGVRIFRLAQVDGAIILYVALIGNSEVK